MNKYEAVIILNPNLSSKVDELKKILKNYYQIIHSKLLKQKTLAEDS